MTLAEIMWPYVERSVERLVALYEEADVPARTWKPPAPESNSLAALVSHTLGNLQDNPIGTVLGDNVAYERQADFDAPEENVTVIRDRWESLRSRFKDDLSTLSDEVLLAEIPHPRRGGITRFETMLVVARHAAEHLAHAELTRDLYLASRAPPP